MSPRSKAYFYLLITAIIWGFASPIVKYSTNFIPPLVMLSYRFAISACLAAVLLPTYRRHLPKNPRDWIIACIYGFMVSSVSLSLYFVGVSRSSSIVGAMGSVFQPVIASIAGVIFLREHVTKREKTGLSIALLGSLVITFEPTLIGSGRHMGTLFGNALLLLSRFADTASSLLAKTILRLKITPLALTHISFVTGLVTMIPITLFFHSFNEVQIAISNAPLGAHAGVLYMALLSGTLAYTLFHAAEKTIEVGEATVSYYLHPVFAAPLSFFWLNEPITPAFITGCLIVAAGVITAGSKKRKFN